MHELHEIKARLMDELEAYGAGNIGKADLDTIHKLSATIKNIDKIEMTEQPSNSMGNGYSYGRHYVRGHYSREDGRQMMSDTINSYMNDPRMSYADRETLDRAKRIMER